MVTNVQTVVIPGVPVVSGGTFATNEQFPLCTGWVASVPQPESARIVLLPPSPNPFNPRTNAAFELASPTATSLRVFTLDGRPIPGPPAMGRLPRVGPGMILASRRNARCLHDLALPRRGVPSAPVS